MQRKKSLKPSSHFLFQRFLIVNAAKFTVKEINLMPKTPISGQILWLDIRSQRNILEG